MQTIRIDLGTTSEVPDVEITCNGVSFLVPAETFEMDEDDLS